MLRTRQTGRCLAYKDRRGSIQPIHQLNQMITSSVTDSATRTVSALTVRFVAPLSRIRKKSAEPSAERMPRNATPMKTFMPDATVTGPLWHRRATVVA